MNEDYSQISNETALLQKLGFENEDKIEQRLATVINRMRTNSSFVAYLMLIWSFLSSISIGFYVTWSDMLANNKYTEIGDLVLQFFLSLGSLFPKNNEDSAMRICLICFIVLLAVWFTLYCIFVVMYIRNKTFSSFIVHAILYIGFYGFTIVSVWVGTTCGYFIKNLMDSTKSDYFTYLAIGVYMAFLYVSYFMDRIYQSSPDVDTFDRFAFWPQNVLPRIYRTVSKYVMPLVLELFRTNTYYIGIIINIIMCIVGAFILLRSETTVFPNGKVVLTSEYLTIIICHIFVFIYKLTGLESYICMIITLITWAISISILAILVQRQSKINIDLLYSKFENLVENIKTPQQCITIIKLGIVYNAPCITNHTLLNWTTNRWPNNQELQLLIAFIFYLLRMKYKEILEIVSDCVDIAPLSTYDSLLFYQIFNRLPTNEAELHRRIDDIKRLYEIPKISLKSFWESVQGRHYQEAVRNCLVYHQNLETINQIFVNLIFENPSSACILEEYIKFNREVMGNKIAAEATEKRLMKMKNPIDEIEENPAESMVQLSRLSSVKSSVFISEFSDTSGEDFDKTKHGIQSAVNARPLYWPTRFFIAAILVSIVSLISCILVFIVSQEKTDRLHNQIVVGLYLHDMQHTVVKLVMYTLEFLTHNATDKANVKFEMESARVRLNNLTSHFDSLISDSFDRYFAFPINFLNSWVLKEINALVLSPDDPKVKNASYMEVLRLFQLNCRTVSQTLDEFLGDNQYPSREVRQIVLYLPSITELLQEQIILFGKIIEDEKEPAKLTIILNFVIGEGISILFMAIALPFICINVTNEFRFITSIYTTISSKSINSILNRQEHYDDFDIFKEETKEHHKILASDTKIYGIVILSLTAVILIPLPAIFNVTSFYNKSEDALFIADSINISSDMISSLGYLYLYSYQTVSDFMNPDLEEINIKFRKETSNIYNKYNHLLFGVEGSDFENGYIYSDTYRDYLNENRCNALSYGNIPKSDCIRLGTSITFLYFHCYRLIKMKKEELPKGFDSYWWRHFSEIGTSIIETLSLEFFNISKTMTVDLTLKNAGIAELELAMSIIIFLIEIAACYIFMKISLAPTLRAMLDPILVLDLNIISDSPQVVKFLQGDFDSAFRTTAVAQKQNVQQVVAQINDFVIEGVLAFDSDGIVIGSNRRYHEMMKSSPIDVNGRSIGDILPASAAPLLDTINSVLNKNFISTTSIQNINKTTSLTDLFDNSTTQIVTTMFTEDSVELPVAIKFVTNKEHSGKNIQSALIFTDKSKIFSYKQTLNNNKERIDNILSRLLPRQILIPFNSGKRNIFIDAPEATVLVAFAVNYSDSTAGLPAKQAISALNLFLREFDTELTAFPNITKIHSYGECFCAVSGIFEDDGTSQQVAMNMVNFGKKLIQAAQMVSNVNSYRFRFRVGIHTGPLQCIVLGEEIPSFEVVGQTLTIARSLERTGKVDNIHISQDTSELIEKSGITLALHKVNVRGYSKQTYLIQNI